MLLPCSWRAFVQGSFRCARMGWEVYWEPPEDSPTISVAANCGPDPVDWHPPPSVALGL
jgi:hypothetical protein